MIQALTKFKSLSGINFVYLCTRLPNLLSHFLINLLQFLTHLFSITISISDILYFLTISFNCSRRRGYAEAEIESVFSKFDANGDRRLDAADVARMKGDLEAQNREVIAEIDRAARKEAESDQRAKDGAQDVICRRNMRSLEPGFIIYMP